MNLCGLILAGGASTRMGTPKALLDWQGETFLDRLIRLFALHCFEVIVVLGHNPEAIPRGGCARYVVNPRPEHGQLSSLQCGLARLPDDAAGFLFTPVDHAPVREETVERVATELRGPHPLVIPRFEGRRGHPVAALRSIAEELLALPPGATARDVIHRHAAETLYVDVADSAAVEDIDDPAAYERMRKGAQ